MSPGCGWPRVAGSLIKKLYFGLKTSKKAGFLAKNQDFSGFCSLVSARESLLKLFIMFYLQGNTLVENCVFGGTGGWVRYRPGTSLADWTGEMPDTAQGSRRRRSVWEKSDMQSVCAAESHLSAKAVAGDFRLRTAFRARMPAALHGGFGHGVLTRPWVVPPGTCFVLISDLAAQRNGARGFEQLGD